MTDKYTPTTESMRDRYATNSYETKWNDGLADEFDRWLAANDREVAAKALREAAEGFDQPDGDTHITYEFVRGRLINRAAAIESGEL